MQIIWRFSSRVEIPTRYTELKKKNAIILKISTRIENTGVKYNSLG